MATVFYPAIIERGPEGFGVFFPDLPGCTSAGDTIQEAALGAEEALSGHLAVSAEYGDDIPAPRDLDAVERDPDVDEVARILVRGERPGKAVRVQISMDEGLLARVDRVAGGNRSGWLARAARATLGEPVGYATQAEAVGGARKVAGEHAIGRTPAGEGALGSVIVGKSAVASSILKTGKGKAGRRSA